MSKKILHPQGLPWGIYAPYFNSYCQQIQIIITIVNPAHECRCDMKTLLYQNAGTNMSIGKKRHLILAQLI